MGTEEFVRVPARRADIFKLINLLCLSFAVIGSIIIVMITSRYILFTTNCFGHQNWTVGGVVECLGGFLAVSLFYGLLVWAPYLIARLIGRFFTKEHEDS